MSTNQNFSSKTQESQQSKLDRERAAFERLATLAERIEREHVTTGVSFPSGEVRREDV